MLNGHCFLFSKGLRVGHLRGIIAVAAELRERYPLGVWFVDSRIEGNFRNVLRLHLPSSSMTDWSMISVRASHLLNFSVGLHGVIAIQNPRRRGPGRCHGGPLSSGRCSRPGSAGRGRRRSLAASNTATPPRHPAARRPPPPPDSRACGRGSRWRHRPAPGLGMAATSVFAGVLIAKSGGFGLPIMGVQDQWQKVVLGSTSFPCWSRARSAASWCRPLRHGQEDGRADRCRVEG